MDLHGLTTTGDSLLIYNNGSLNTVDLSGLIRAAGYLNIELNLSLAALDLSALTATAGDLQVAQTALCSDDVAALEDQVAVAGSFTNLENTGSCP